MKSYNKLVKSGAGCEDMLKKLQPILARPPAHQHVQFVQDSVFIGGGHSGLPKELPKLLLIIFLVLVDTLLRVLIHNHSFLELALIFGVVFGCIMEFFFLLLHDELDCLVEGLVAVGQ